MAGAVAAQEAVLPPVEIIQKTPLARSAPAAAPRRAAPAPIRPGPNVARAAAPTPLAADFDPEAELYEAAANTDLSAVSPASQSAVVPADLQNYAGAASRVNKAQIEENRPLTNHELLDRVPGVATVNDDGLARHSGIGIRGAPFRRSRKVLVLEDGDSINFSSYIDPSTHYTPPVERVESVEVIRGGTVAYGPLNNHGVVNFRNFDPFGPEETVLSGWLGHTKGAVRDVNYNAHFHHRQQVDNVGVVVLTLKSEGAGAWDNEVLRYDDFYGAIGWKGSDQDLVLSGVYYRQRDRYDEANATPDQFEAFGRCKQCFDPNSDFNSYSSDIMRVQALHNYYVDPDTTASTRIYGFYNDRPRFETETEDEPQDRDDDRAELGEDFTTEGRLRRYHHYGVEEKLEFRNRPFFWGLSQDIQVGARYEYHEFDYKIVFGDEEEKLNYDDRNGNGRISLDERYESDAFATFVQSAIHVTPRLTLVPGLRIEIYDVERTVLLDEGRDIEAGEGIVERSDFSHVLPGLGMSYKLDEKSTLYGGVYRGHTPHVARGDSFPLAEEVGINGSLGVRSTAFTGLTLDAAVFHANIDDYQIKEPFTEEGRSVFSFVDNVEINGFEMYARLDSKPHVPSSFNLFGEVTYTFSDSKIAKGTDNFVNVDGDEVTIDVSGNRLPEVPRHLLNLTAGVEHESGWDASVTASYRGSFFTDVANNRGFFCEFEVEDGDDELEFNAPCNNPGVDDAELDEVAGGFVEGIWLLSARANYKIPDTGATVFIAGQNLTDELYITDLSDGLKPGQGRTFWGGVSFRYTPEPRLEAASLK